MSTNTHGKRALIEIRGTQGMSFILVGEEREGDNPFSLILQYGRTDEQGTRTKASNKGDGKPVFYSSPESLKRSKGVGRNGRTGQL